MSLHETHPTPLKNVAVILVNWKGAHDTVDCVRSLLSLSYSANLNIVVTDNCSPDGSVDYIRNFMLSEFPREQFREVQVPQQFRENIKSVMMTGPSDLITLTLLTSDRNGGFAYGNNLGIKFIDLYQEIDYYWILNNDTVVDAEALGAMVHRMDSDSNIGILGCTILYYNDRQIVQAFGGVNYSYITGRGKYIGEGMQYPPSRSMLDTISGLEPTYISGASMFVRASYCRDVGLMSEEYFLYCEEIDWSWRGRDRYRFSVEPRAVVLHKEGASIGTTTRSAVGSAFSEFFQARNKLKFARTYTPLFFPAVFAVLALKCLRLFIGGYSNNAEAILFALFGKQTPQKEWSAKRATSV